MIWTIIAAVVLGIPMCWVLCKSVGSVNKEIERNEDRRKALDTTGNGDTENSGVSKDFHEQMELYASAMRGGYPEDPDRGGGED